METIDEGSGSDARDARASLEQARQAEDALRGPDAPWWYFLLSAALFAAWVLTQLLGDRWTDYFLAVGIAIVALNVLAARRAGVMGQFSRNRGFLAALFLIGVVVAGSIFWYRATGQAWTVVAMAATVAVLMLVGGWLYRRNPS